MAETRIVSFSETNGIEVPLRVMEDMGLKQGDKFLIYTESGVVHLRKVDDSATVVSSREREDKEREEFLSFVENWFLTNLQGFEKRMTFQGNLAGMHLAEILLFLAMTKKTGILILKREKVTKKIYYERGDIVFAASSLGEERLGDILMKEEKITQEQYDQSAERIEPDKRQGRVLVDMGVINPEELWEIVCEQVEAIVYSLFQWEQGYFEFLEGSLPTEERIKLDVSIPNLILEGLRRAEKNISMEQHLPEGPQILHQLAADWDEFGETHLTPEEKNVLSQVTSGMTVDEVCKECSLPGQDARQILFRLLSAGLLRISKGKGDYPDTVKIDDAPRLTDRIEQCNIIFRLITEYVRAAIGDRVHVILGAFFRGIDHGQEILFEHVSLEADGSLSPRQLLVNLSEYLPEERESILVRGLNELLYFQLFAVRNNLGPEQEQQVIGALREMEFLE